MIGGGSVMMMFCDDDDDDSDDSDDHDNEYKLWEFDTKKSRNLIFVEIN